MGGPSRSIATPTERASAMSPELAVERARALVGTRFVPQGRGADGVDCVGLAAAAYGAAVRRDYALRSGDLRALSAGIEAAGLLRTDEPAPGDLLVMEVAAGQLHLGVWTGASTVHADARLRKVVERPGAPPWPVIGRWRLAGELAGE